MESITQRKSTGVLNRMLKNLDEKSLERTRMEMCTPEDYTDYLINAYDMGKMTMREVIKHAMKYVSGKMEDKVYAITSCSYEYDDLGYPGLSVKELYLTKDERDAALENLIKRELDWFHMCKSEYESRGGNPDEYEVVDLGDLNETVVRLELVMGKWVYEWGIAEFPLLTFNKEEKNETV